MGYDSRHTLTWKETPAYSAPPTCPHKPPSTAKFCAECGNAVGTLTVRDLVATWVARKGEDIAYCIAPDGRCIARGMWRDIETDLRELSKLVPGVIFHLAREGADYGDIYDTFALDGMVQEHRAEIRRVEYPVDGAWT
jgi:hypothetical protein